MNEKLSSPKTGYMIRVIGPLEIDLSGWSIKFFLKNEILESGESVGCLFCQVEDQPRLRGILNLLWDQNRIILSVTRINFQEECFRGEII